MFIFTYEVLKQLINGSLLILDCKNLTNPKTLSIPVGTGAVRTAAAAATTTVAATAAAAAGPVLRAGRAPAAAAGAERAAPAPDRPAASAAQPGPPAQPVRHGTPAGLLPSHPSGTSCNSH
jgi:hypothetical protein